MKSIVSYLKGKVKKIIVAWGQHPAKYKNQYLKRINEVISILFDKEVFYVGKISEKERYPLHAQVWGYGMQMFNYAGIRPIKAPRPTVIRSHNMMDDYALHKDVMEEDEKNINFVNNLYRTLPK